MTKIALVGMGPKTEILLRIFSAIPDLTISAIYSSTPLTPIAKIYCAQLHIPKVKTIHHILKPYPNMIFLCTPEPFDDLLTTLSLPSVISYDTTQGFCDVMVHFMQQLDSSDKKHLPHSFDTIIPGKSQRSYSLFSLQSLPLREEITPLYALERTMITRALEKHGQTTSGKKAAAHDLNISLATLYNKIKRYRIDPL